MSRLALPPTHERQAGAGRGGGRGCWRRPPLGSTKNITPKRDTTRSNAGPGAAASRSAVWASAVTTVAVGTRRCAASTIAGEMSMPTAWAPAATAASSNVPDPHPTSSTRRADAEVGRAQHGRGERAKAASKIRSLRTHPSAPVAHVSRIASFATPPT